ncbi:MAG: futalosine hydrolase [Bacteroidota bacterium]|nr:MAG: futalosine hydrolase [Bacteroidota bacterium]
MKILFITATEMEMQALKPESEWHAIEQCITGVGLLNTTLALQFISIRRPDLLIQAGIGGSLSDAYQPGEVVAISKETIADLGSEDGDRFISVWDAGLSDPNSFPFQQGWIENPHLSDFSLNIPIQQGLSVNAVAGSISTVTWRKERYKEGIENMEGAAFHAMARLAGIPFLQIRGISNRVEVRDRSNWKIEETLQNTKQVVQHLIDTLP